MLDTRTHEGVREFVRAEVYPVAVRTVTATGGHPPMAIIFAMEFDGERFSEPTPIGFAAEHAFTTQHEKAGFRSLIRQAVKASRATGVVFICEARLAALPADTDLSHGAPSPASVPGCRDVLAFMLQSERETSLFVADVFPSHTGAVLGPLEEPLPGAMSFGAYGDFFGSKVAEA